MNTASLSRGLLSRIEVSSQKKKTTHFVLNPPCWGGFHLVSIEIAKMRFGTQGAHFPVNWMELS